MENQSDRLSTALKHFTVKATPQEVIIVLDCLEEKTADVLAACPDLRAQFDNLRGSFLRTAAA